MPSVTFCLPWPTLSVAPLPPRLVLTPVLLRLILTPGSTLNVLRKRKYPIGLMPLVDWSRCVLAAPGLSGLFDHDSPHANNAAALCLKTVRAPAATDRER